MSYLYNVVHTCKKTYIIHIHMSGRNDDYEGLFVHLAGFVTAGRLTDAASLIRKTLPGIAKHRPDLASEIQRAGARASDVLRQTRTTLPGAANEQQSLVRHEERPVLDIAPVWPASVQSTLGSVVVEREREAALRDAGIEPTRTLLFVGAPGVGKTLAAKWLARELGRPLVTLDLAAVMSSFLGKTGNNIRTVLDYARSHQAVLLLDEFDAIAKRRDDAADIGELKRLVTVLLQAIDDWPSESLLIAATNHPELLDPAAWRRFERVIQFPLPSPQETREVLQRALGPSELDDTYMTAAAAIFAGRGFADIVREVRVARRDAVVFDVSLEESLARRLKELTQGLPLEARLSLAQGLAKAKISQRMIRELSGISRDTLRDRGIGTKSTKG